MEWLFCCRRKAHRQECLCHCGLRRGRREKGEDIGPFWFAVRKIAKDLGKLRPGAEAALEGAMVEFPQLAVEATRGDFLVFANGAGPIFEEFAVFEAGCKEEDRRRGGRRSNWGRTGRRRARRCRRRERNSEREGGRPAPRAMAAIDPRINSLSGGGRKGAALFTDNSIPSDDTTCFGWALEHFQFKCIHIRRK